MKTSELTGAALDWAVAKADSHRVAFQSGHLYLVDEKQRRITAWTPSTAWAQGGPIIEREHIGVCYYHEADGWEIPNWAAWRTDIDDRVQIMGETALIAAMRCYVASKLGDEVDVPEELLK